MNIITLDKKSFKDKFIHCYEKYLKLSSDATIAIGIFHKDNYYVFGNGTGASYLYDIGSISKTFTAYLVLSLYCEGLIDLEDTVDKYIPLKKGSYPKIINFLTHTCGYNHLTPVELTVPSLLKSGYAKRNIYEKCTSDTVIKCLERRSKFKKTSKYAYSDFTYAVMAVLCECVLKKSFKEILEDFIKTKLSLDNTFVKRIDDDSFPKAIKGKKELPFWIWNTNNPYIASGGIVSNITDMIKYIDLTINSNEDYIKNAHIINEDIKTNSNIRICKGWHSYQKSNQLWHVGGVSTFRSTIIVNKIKKYGVVVLGNMKGKKSANVNYLAKMIYSELKYKRIKFK